MFLGLCHMSCAIFHTNSNWKSSLKLQLQVPSALPDPTQYSSRSHWIVLIIHWISYFLVSFPFSLECSNRSNYHWYLPASYLSQSIYIYLSICMSVYLPQSNFDHVYLSTNLRFHIYLSIFAYIYLYIYIIYLYLSIFAPIYLYISVYIDSAELNCSK